jgi:hypothetical protein
MLRRAVSEGPQRSRRRVGRRRSETPVRGGGRARRIALPRRRWGLWEGCGGARRVSRGALGDGLGRARGDRVEVICDGSWEGVGGGRRGVSRGSLRDPVGRRWTRGFVVVWRAPGRPVADLVEVVADLLEGSCGGSSRGTGRPLGGVVRELVETFSETSGEVVGEPAERPSERFPGPSQRALAPSSKEPSQTPPTSPP